MLCIGLCHGLVRKVIEIFPKAGFSLTTRLVDSSWCVAAFSHRLWKSYRTITRPSLQITAFFIGFFLVAEKIEKLGAIHLP